MNGFLYYLLFQVLQVVSEGNGTLNNFSLLDNSFFELYGAVVPALLPFLGLRFRPVVSSKVGALKFLDLLFGLRLET